MRVIHDASRCELHGECMIAAPDVFTIEDNAEVATLLNSEPGEDQRAAVEEAAMMCPVGAIRIEG